MSYGFLTFDATLVTSYWTHQRCCMEPLGEKKISQLTWTPFLDKEETWRQKAAITCDKMSPATQDADITINNGIKCHIYNENQWQQSRKRNFKKTASTKKKKNTALYHEFSIIQSKSIIAASAPATFKVKMPQRLTVSAGPKWMTEVRNGGADNIYSM